MDSKMHQTVEINLKDLFFVMLKKVWIIVLAGFILAGTLFGYKMVSGTNDVNVLDVSSKVDGETDVEYSERVLNVNRAKDIINSINSLNDQIDQHREYVANSLLMQIDVTNEAVATAQLIVTIDDSTTSGMDNALVASYSEDLKSGEYLNELADTLGTKQEYLKELITTNYASSGSVVVNTDGASDAAGTVTITIVGPNLECTESIMDCVLEELYTKHLELNETMVPHTITLAGRQSFFMVDNVTRDLQYNAINRFEIIQKQIDTYDEALVKIASKIGVNDKDILYTYFESQGDSTSKSSSVFGSAVKFAFVGFAIGAFISVLIIAFEYLFSKKFNTQSKFFGHFPWVNKIGISKPAIKRSRFIVFIDRITGDDDGLSDENSIRLMAANVRNLTTGMDKVLFTGTSEKNKISELVKALEIKADVAESIFTNPAVLKSISDYDGVIIVEQRNYSNCKQIDEELKLIANADTELIGAIIV